ATAGRQHGRKSSFWILTAAGPQRRWLKDWKARDGIVPRCARSRGGERNRLPEGDLAFLLRGRRESILYQIRRWRNCERVWRPREFASRRVYHAEIGSDSGEVMGSA